MASDNHVSYVKIGATVLVGAVITVATMIYLGGLRGNGSETILETYYDKSVSGLSVGSVVNFRGVKIGEVRAISFVGCKYNVEGRDAGKVYIEMAISHELLGLGPELGSREKLDRLLYDRMVSRGMRATVTSSGITGLSRIEINFTGEIGLPPPKFAWTPEHYYIPPQDSLLDSFSDSATKVMNQINRMDLNRAWSNINASVESLAFATTSTRNMLAAHQADLERVLDDMEETTATVKDLARELKRNPSLLIREREVAPLSETEGE